MSYPTRPGSVGSKRSPNQKYFLSDSGREILIKHYNGEHETTQMLVRCLGVPRHVIYRWARELGIKQRKTRTWTKEEIFYLESKLHIVSMDDLCTCLDRTEASIIQKAQQLGLSKMHEGYTMNALAAGFGVHYDTVERWVEKGWLKGKRRQTRRTYKGDIWYFSDANVREFVKRHPEHVDPRKADWLWLVDVLCGGLGELGGDHRERSD